LLWALNAAERNNKVHDMGLMLQALSIPEIARIVTITIYAFAFLPKLLLAYGGAQQPVTAVRDSTPAAHRAVL